MAIKYEPGLFVSDVKGVRAGMAIKKGSHELLMITK